MVSTIASALPFSSGGDSDTNLSEIYSGNGSLRRRLLQRLSSQECQRFKRTGSSLLSPQYSQRSRCTWRHINTPSPSVCWKCQSLDAARFERLVPESTSKRAKYCIASSLSSFEERLHLIETVIDSPNIARTPHFRNVVHEEQKCSIESSSNASDDANKNDSAIEDGSAFSTTTNALQIETDEDRANFLNTSTRIETTESSAPSQSSTSETTMLESTTREHLATSNKSVQTRLLGIKIHPSNGQFDKCGNFDSVVTTADSKDDGCSTSEATTATMNIDQSTIDSFISQILVDSLNNIIVVEGTVSGPSTVNDNNLGGVVHSVSCQTDASLLLADDHHYMQERPSVGELSFQQKINFPQYFIDESPSEYSAKYSNDSTVIELADGNVEISVVSGSSYPLDGGELIVRRYTQRTESMEVRPPSGTMFENDTIGELDEDNDNDTDSLVDSLDEPTDKVGASADEIRAIKPIEKSKAFFVSMDDGDQDRDTAAEQETVCFTVGDAMPERLRKRLQRRQTEMSRRKRYETKRKQEKFQRIVESFESECAVVEDVSGHSEVLDALQGANTPTAQASTDVVPAGDSVAAPLKKRNAIHASLSSTNADRRIQLLESYTVDAKGNLRFQEPQKARKMRDKKTGLTVKREATKISTRSAAPLLRKPREIVTTKVVAVKRTNTIAGKPLSKGWHRGSKDLIIGRRTDLQKMTLYHHSPSDIVTPDADCGPRRMYQKTEIHDGKKRIEILEIVECVNSSPDNMATTTVTTSTASTVPTGAPKSSKIPVPVMPLKKSTARLASGHKQQLSTASIPASTNHSVSRSSLKNLANNNSKVDQIIADLLIEAMHSSTDIGIEFVQTPQQDHANAKISNNKRVCLKTMAATSSSVKEAKIGRRNSVSSGGKRSAHGSGKYQRVFEAIPEEKTNSLSTDSPENNDKRNNAMENTSQTSETISSSITFTQETLAESKDAPTNAERVVERPMNGPARGKEAVQSDQEKPEAWFDCFGQRHNESPIDAALLEQGTFTVIHKSF